WRSRIDNNGTIPGNTDDPQYYRWWAQVTGLPEVPTEPGYINWAPGLDLPAGQKVMSDGRRWRVVTAHTSQPDWEPGLPGLEALWEEITAGATGPEPWTQPAGAHNAYYIKPAPDTAQ